MSTAPPAVIATPIVVLPFALSVNPAVTADALLEKDMLLFVTKANVVDIFAVFAVTKLFTVMSPVPAAAPIVNIEAVIFANSALSVVIPPDVSPTPIVPVDTLLESDTLKIVVLLPLVKDVPFKMKSFAVMVRGLFVVDNVFEAASVKSPDPSSSLSVSINVVPFVVTFWLRVTPESALSVNPAVNAEALFENVIVLFVTKVTVVDIFAVFAVTKLSTVMLPVPDEAPIVNVEAVIF